MRIERIVAAAALAAALSGVGCGDPTAASVSGKVEVGGKPIPEGTVQFVPADGKSPTTGGPVKDGRYSVRMTAGQMKVLFSAPKVVGQKKIYNTPNSPSMPITVEALPPKYNERTELTMDVKPGSNTKDWTLEEK